MLVDVASLKAYYETLPLKTDHTPILFGRRAHMLRARVNRSITEIFRYTDTLQQA
jgi:hypothetical protein